jgi:GT2 family glycosyltransferase
MITSPKKEITIIIPSWNGKHLLKKNLPKVISTSKNPKNKIKQIIVVDDYSTDDTVSFLEKNYKEEIRLIKHTKNRGFSSAINTGVKMASTPLVCLLNQDVSPTSNFLFNIPNHFKDNKVFAVSLHEKGYGPATGSFKEGYIHHFGAKESSKVQNSLWASGGSAVFRRKIWLKLKGFDETLLNPFYWEDLDICYRAQKRGYLVYWEPNSYVFHNHESVINPSNFKRKFLEIIKERNELLVIWKNITSRRLIKKHILAVIKRTLKHPGYLLVITAALAKLPKVKAKRKIEAKQSTVSDEAIFAKFTH